MKSLKNQIPLKWLADYLILVGMFKLEAKRKGAEMTHPRKSVARHYKRR